jgi:hypothetical protein
MTHAFAQSLTRSQSHAEASWWGEVYRQAFVDFGSMLYVANDGWAQRSGIDRVITCKSGKVHYVDEKVRDKAWPDFALEVLSDRDRNLPGWARRDLACDFLAYAFVPIRRCYLIPFVPLRAAWLKHVKEWVALAYSGIGAPAAQRPRQGVHRGEAGFGVTFADNGRYVTECVTVPIDVLSDAVREALIVEWRPEVVLAA